MKLLLLVIFTFWCPMEIHSQSPTVNISRSHSEVVYAGSQLTMTSHISVIDGGGDISVQISWTRYNDVIVNTTSTTVYAVSGNESYYTASLSFSSVTTSDAGPITATVTVRQTVGGNEQTVTISATDVLEVAVPRPEVAVSATNTELVFGSHLTLSCSIQHPSLSTATTIQSHWITPHSRHDRINRVNDTEPQLVISSVEKTDGGEYICIVRVSDSSGIQYILDSPLVTSKISITIKLNVTITAAYTPAPGGVLGELGPHQFTAGSVLYLRCLVQGHSTDLNYSWSLSGNPSTPGCGRCRFFEPSTTSIQSLPHLHSYHAGIYTCTVSEIGQPDTNSSNNFSVSIVGAGIYAFASKREISSGPIANNGLVVVNNGDVMQVDCLSNSSHSGVGALIAPDEIRRTPDNITGSWAFVDPYYRPGVVRLQRHPSYSPEPFTDPGIFTFTTPDSNGHTFSFNVGLYPRGFNKSSIITSLTYNGSRTLTCVSTRSPATTVTWMKDGQPLTPDGSSHYLLSQTITDRRSSTYSNVLTVRDGVPGGVTGTYNCTVCNDLGCDSSDVIVGDSYPVHSYEVSDTSVTLFLSQSSTEVGYNLTCVPVIQEIPIPQPLMVAPADKSATVTGLFSGVSYNCSMLQIDMGSSNSLILSFSTIETAPSGSPQMFAAVAGEREVVFSWSPPPVIQRNGVITNYTLSCSPSPSSLPQSPTSQSGLLTVAGFSPNTTYSCSLLASNSKGSGPTTNVTFTTQDDFLLFQLRFGGLPVTCPEFIMLLDVEEISFAVIEQLNISFCAQCGRGVLHNEFLVCYPESPSFVTYRARLEGTPDTDSDSLISLIEKWVVRGGVIINSTGGLMQVDSDCLVVISSFSEPECSLTNERVNNKGTYVITVGIAAGILALVLLTISFGFIMLFVCMKTQHGHNPNKRHKSPASITTSHNGAYEEVISKEEVEHDTSTSGVLPLENAYEVPLPPSKYLPRVTEEEGDYI